MSKEAILAQLQSTEELIAVLARECELRRQSFRTAKLGSVFLVLGLFGLSLFAWMHKGTPPIEFLKDYYAFFLVALGGAALSANHRRALLQVRTADPRLAGFLIEALSYRDLDIVQHAEDKLDQQLPRTESLSREHSQMLAARLAGSKNLNFIRAALGALRRHGGPECLDGIAELMGRKTPRSGKERFERLETLALQVSADVRLRSARQTIESEH